MTTPLYYYAMLNENDVCFGFTSLGIRMAVVPPNIVALPEQNESYRWKRYNRELGAFEQETYAPDLAVQVQERMNEIDVELVEYKNTNSELEGLTQTLQGSIMELTETLAAVMAMFSGEGN